jgi:hypothetical protein
MFINELRKRKTLSNHELQGKKRARFLIGGLWGSLGTAACGKDAAESFESLWHCGAKGHRPDAAETGMA